MYRARREPGDRPGDEWVHRRVSTYLAFRIGLVWYGMLLFGLVWYGFVWFGLVGSGTELV